MFSLAKFIGLLAAATIIPVTLGAADLVPVQGLARRAAFGNPDELMVDGIDIAGRRRSLSSQNNLEQNR